MRLGVPLTHEAPRVRVSAKALSTPLTRSHVQYVKKMIIKSLLTCILNLKQIAYMHS